MLVNEVENLQGQLTVARNEINKLRQQIRSLQHIQRKDVENISCMLKNFRCNGCLQAAEENYCNSNETLPNPTATLHASDSENVIKFRPIGIIRTSFPEKRAVPRQSNVGGHLRGAIELNSDFFTNPDHSIQGLDEYSHLWLIYHFHKNNSHPKAKVAPPRLGGERVGVFSTRSPHRPCPIGMSLVEIDKIENHTITFFGTDMIDGTPVLDIKPYIPFYDTPMTIESGRTSVGPIVESFDFYDSRQEPDGEESELESLGAGAIGGHNDDTNGTNTSNLDNQMSIPSNTVKIPKWVLANQRLVVCFNERAETQLKELQVHKQCITDILEADPRSVYLRTKYGSQIFTFQLSEVTVTCKFDDTAGTVTVVQIRRRTENVQDDTLSEHGY